MHFLNLKNRQRPGRNARSQIFGVFIEVLWVTAPLEEHIDSRAAPTDSPMHLFILYTLILGRYVAKRTFRTAR
jgi:hypothetical protein